MDLSGAIEDRLKSAQNAFDSLAEAPVGDNPRLAWLERQLTHIVGQLRGLKEDVDCGWFASGAGGVFSDGEIEEMLDDFAVSIANLKGLIQTAKMLGR